MARDPGSLWSPLKEDGRQGSYAKTQFIVHSTGDRGSAAAIYGYFNRDDIVVESTFVIGRGPEDPTRQLLDSASVADANLGANRSGIAVEVVGTADDPFTDWQISELIRLGRWAHGEHPIPFQVVPAPTAGGYGWHVMFGAPGPWTPVAKSCPGRVRINQLQSVVFPAIFAGTAPTTGGDELSDPNVVKVIQETANTVAALLSVAERPIEVERRLNARLDALEAKLTAVTAPAAVNAAAVVDEFLNRLAARPAS